MKCSEVEKIIVDGQVLYCPNLEQWQEILQGKSFDGVPIKGSSTIELIKYNIVRNSEYSIIKSCIAVIYNKMVMYYELLQLEDEYYRVYIESIICDYCGNRAEISASPWVSDIYLGLDNLKEQEARKRVRKLPNLTCPNCGKTYDRRYTIWQVS